MAVRLAELAVRFGCELRGDADAEVDRVATLQEGGPGSLAFLANARYRRYLADTRATAVVLEQSLADECPVAALIHANPYATYARIAALLHPPASLDPGVHATATVEPGAFVDATASVGAGCSIGAGVRIGARAVLGPGCVVMRGAHVGEATRLVARVTLCEGVRIGARCILQPGCVIGADGFGHAPDAGRYVKVPQLGAVVIGDDVEIGANSAIDRGAIGDTIIEDGVRVDNLVQIGHNARIGAHTVIAGCTGISGSTTIGRRCVIAGMVGIAGHLSICDDVVVTGKTMVSSSIHRPGMYSGTLHAEETRRFRRNAARFQKLDELAKRVRRLESGGTGGQDGDD
jgi:UDP-3-O-[3-hydroxymyristoyl] glucosamine N-acyltransferase